MKTDNDEGALSQNATLGDIPSQISQGTKKMVGKLSRVERLKT